jgi:hypothetical protein
MVTTEDRAESLRMRGFLATACTACIALAASCSAWTLSYTAREAFAKSVSCPPDQVDVRKRPDVAPHSIADQLGLLGPPSPDVAANPVRLRYWEQQRADLVRRLDDWFTVYDVRGCGAQQLLCCARDSEDDRYCDKNCTNVMAPGSP